MSYLALCQRVARRAGVAGASRGLPDGVTGQPERLQLVCDLVAEAVREIETAYTDWTFMRTSVDFFVEAGDTFIDPRETQPDVMSLNEAAVYGRTVFGEQRIHPMPWPALRELRETATTLPVQGMPSYFATDTAGIIQLYPSALVAFALRAELVLSPSELTAAADEPRIPTTHHDAIVWRALALYHEADEADMLRQTAEMRYGEWLSRLEAAFLPSNAWSRTHSPETPLVVVCE